LVFNVSGSVCLQVDSKGAFVTATGATPPDNMEPMDYGKGSYGMGGGGGIGIQVSDAKTKDSLRDEFKFGGGSAGPVAVEYSWGKGSEGEDVHATYAGWSVGAPGGNGGKSNTWVSGYGPPWTKAALCPVCQLF
jgi:hypothetical protein